MTLQQLIYVIELSKERSINDAAKRLYIAQSGLTAALKSLEQELGFEIFNRTKAGISLTPKGSEFLGYARSVVEQYERLDTRFISRNEKKRTFQVSMQHYTFAVDAFIRVINEYGLDEYEFEIHETKTYEVIENVRDRKSEIGVLYLNDDNRDVLGKVIKDADLTFTPLFDCGIYAYMSKNNPLASKDEVTLQDLEPYPCLAFAQGDYNSVYFAEEVLSTHEYKRLVRASDRATLLNLMVGINGYTLCSGIICEDLNGTDYCAVKLKTDAKMTIGYVALKSIRLSETAERYIEELKRFKEQVLA